MKMPFGPSARSSALKPHECAVTWQACSLLLDYPDERMLAGRSMLRRAVAPLPAFIGEPLTAFLDHLDVMPQARLAADYVATFDHRKRCCLYLTYYSYGDTRKRGMALLRIKQTYRAAGLVLDDGELPDHLAVVLEFGATADPETALRLLTEYRAGLELLRLALTEADSPWAHVLHAISASLPPLDGDGRTAVQRLAAAGPPEEEVGLAPFGSSDGPVFLPEPRLRVDAQGART
ncbi:nitrate reductase molybdenum cofactor assembly chaperone [Spirillospora sp. NPDC048911]|uniref:nitrate reductase molybdenum cofactor assembly chaperone n=1 Tax=Spirillospora sp. NPDC048911 TaxID=3364527 RepID=UPI0037199D0C